MQGNNFDSLYLLMNELVARQRLLNPSFKLKYSEALPFKDFFDILEERSSIAQSYKRVSDEMAQKTNQLLLIQKRLLTRYKEKNSAPLNQLDFLLESSVSDLIAQTKEFEQLQLLYKKNSQKVTVSFKIIMSLLSMRFSISDDGMRLLQKYLPSQVEASYQEVGWVEIVDKHIFFLLKNVLLGKEDPASTSYSKVDSLQAFQQHFMLLVDKISKGLLENYKAPKETSVIASKL